MKTLWGIDLGGTKVEGVVLESLENPKAIKRLRVSTEAEKGYEHILNQIKNLVEKMSEETGYKPERIGIGTPGTLDPLTQTLKNSNTLCLNGKHFKKDLEKLLGIEILIANDANCFALAEAKMGIVKEKMPEAQVVFGVIMGTGVGGGVIVDGKIIGGRHGIGGEWGHIFLDESGGKCYCGRTGCVETILSGPSLQRYYERVSGKSLSLKDIVANANNGSDDYAKDTIDRLHRFFGKGICQIINVLDPDVIVLGGGLGNIDSLYSLGVEEAKKHIFNPKLETPFLKPSLGDSAGVFGAAMLVS